MSFTDISPDEHTVIRDKAIKYIKGHWGLLDDLPSVFIPVVWVTVFRALDTGSQFQNSHSETLQDVVELAFKLKTATAKLKFLRTIITQLRDKKDYEQRLGACYLFIDVLRWNITDAAEMGRFERLRKRITAKADPLYRYPIPAEIWNRA